MNGHAGPSVNHRAARWYAEHGLAVFPLVPKTKVPVAGSHGELDGTIDRAIIDAIWGRRPDLLVAVALRFTDYFVVDVDARHGGHENLDELEQEHGKLPATWTAITGGGWPNCHYWFRRTAALEDARARTLAEGIDLKGLRAGYVVLPPSTHPSGGRYVWEISSRPDDIPIADPPKWMERKITGRSPRKKFEAHQHEASVDPTTFFLGAAFLRAGWLGREVRPGVFAVRCPNDAAHSQGQPFDGSAVVFAPRTPGGRGHFFCQHTSGCSEVFR